MSPARFASLLLLLLACAPPTVPGAPDTGALEPTDAAEAPDAGAPDDAGLAPPVVPLEGFGAIAGECGVLDDELTSPENSVLRNAIDFGTDPFDPSDADRLSTDGRRLYASPNAGGSSALSELFSFELLHRCELASLVKTETEVAYDDPSSKLTDILVRIDGLLVGVSVTRAMSYPVDAPYTVAAAKTLLTKKLGGIRDSTLHVVAEDRWVKQILHVLADTPGHADAMATAWSELDGALRGDTILLLSVSDGDDRFIYTGQ
jgi:hypothetical protein